MVRAGTPTLAKIRNEASETDARALLYIAVCELCDFFNVGKNMNDTQIGLTVDLILESYWYFRLEEVKYCFRRAMARGKLFDRLDGNIILGWLREYDNERTEEAMRASDQAESERLNAPCDNPGAVSFERYTEILRERAESGDEDAAARLKEIDEGSRGAASAPTLDGREREIKFKQGFYQKYLKRDRK